MGYAKKERKIRKRKKISMPKGMRKKCMPKSMKKRKEKEIKKDGPYFQIKAFIQKERDS